MSKIDDILGELARKSYQNKKETASYLPLVAEAKLAILEVLREMVGKKKRIHFIGQCCGEWTPDRIKGHNDKIDDINSKIEKEIAELKQGILKCEYNVLVPQSFYKKILGDEEHIKALSIPKSEALTNDFIQKHYDEFLGYYYNSPCSGCKDGHSSFWKTITESQEWKAWQDSGAQYDFAECNELGIIGKQHFKDFIKFVRKPEPLSVEELTTIIQNVMRTDYFYLQDLASAIHKRIGEK